MIPPLTHFEIEKDALVECARRDDFAGAQAAVQRLVRAVEAGLPYLDTEARGARLKETMQLIESCRRSLRASHARMAGELSLLQARARYLAPAVAPAVNTWRLSG